jgi:HPt (histidine-containing phosphotransfer) domain-containing protein
MLRTEIAEITKKRIEDMGEMMKKNEESISEPAWNLAELLGRVDNDQELIRELLTIFREDFPRTLQSLEAAVCTGDLKNSAALSHTLKGMLASLGVTRAAAAAAKIEKLASASAGKEALREAFEALRNEAARLMPELEAYMTEVPR